MTYAFLSPLLTLPAADDNSPVWSGLLAMDIPPGE